MSKNIQISNRLFCLVVKLLIRLQSCELDSDTRELCDTIERLVDDKFVAINRREAFTAYKTSKPSSEERENSRKRYLEMSGISADWVSDRETNI